MPVKEKSAAPVFTFLFFCSGMAGLGFQVVWAKAFAAGIGSEFPAVLAVITAFMSGMGAGAVALNRFSHSQILSPRWYGILELVIGGWGAATALLIPSLNGWIIQALGPEPSAAFQWAMVFAGVFLALLPATAAMGATLPALEFFIAEFTARRATGLLYSANTAGAMAGCLASAFWILPSFGIRTSILSFAVLNLLCGIAALWLTSRPRNAQQPSEPAPRHRIEWGLTTRLFLAGMLGISFEVAMVRGLSHILENTVYTFAVVLAIYLLGNAIGAALFQVRHRAKGWAREQNAIFPALAIACLVSAILLRSVPALYQSLRRNLGDSTAAVATSEMLAASAVFLLPAILMGLTFAWLAQQSLRFRSTLAWSVAVNTAGAAIAPLLTGIAIIPAFGLRGAFAAIAIAYALLPGRSKLAWTAALVALALPLITSSPQLVQRGPDKIISFDEGVMGTVAVLESTNGARVLKVNNRFQMGGTAARIAEERQGAIPLLLHPNPRRALFIGLGTGISFSAARNFPALRAEGVELVAEVAEAMNYFQEPAGALASPNLRVHIADGRRYIQSVTNRYDVIVGDLFHPAQDGAGFLYTVEHFAAARERLNPGGLFCQWLPVYQMDLQTIAIIVNSAREVFSNVDLWLLRFNVDTPVVGIIARNDTPVFTADWVEARTAQAPELAELLSRLGLSDSIRLFGCYLGPATQFPDSILNTDNHPVILFRAPQLTFQRNDVPSARLLELVGRFPPSLAPLNFAATAQAFQKRTENYMQARNVYLRGLVAESKGDFSEALSAYIQSAQVSPEFTSGYAQALAIATTVARSNPAAAIRILQSLAEAQPERPVARELLQRLMR